MAGNIFGTQSQKPPRYAPLFTNRFFTGLWTQRSPLRDAATQLDQERYYGARYDSIWDGRNVEITNRLTLARRPGLSVYNSESFPPILQFYDFKQIVSGNQTIRVIVDTEDVVYDATGPSTKATIYTKGSPGRAYFQGVGEYLYIGTGLVERKWEGTTTDKWGIDAPATSPESSINGGFPAGTIDSATIAVAGAGYVNGEIVTVSGGGGTGGTFQLTVAAGVPIAVTKVTGGMGYSTTAGAATTGGSGAGLTLNITVLTAATVAFGYPTWQANTTYAPPFTNGVFVIIDDNFNLQEVTVMGTSGATVPTWATTLGATTIDGSVTWTNVGNIARVTVDYPERATSYCFSYKSSADQSVSSASDPIIYSNESAGEFQTVHHVDGSPFTLNGPSSSDAQVDKIRIYRRLSGGSTFFFLAEIDNPYPTAEWVYEDTVPDIGLNQFIQAPIDDQNDPPPIGLIKLSYHLGRIFGVVGNRVYYSQGPSVLDGNGNTAFDHTKFFEYPSTVQRIWPMAMGALVFTNSDVYIILGQGTSNSPLFSIPFLPKVGLLSFNAFDVNGGVAYLITTDKTGISFDPTSGYSEVGFPIGDLIEDEFTEENAYVAWHNGGSRDKALYITRAAGTDTDDGFRGVVVPSSITIPGNVVIASILPSLPDPTESLELFLNGVLQTEGVDYNLSGSLAVWVVQPTTADKILAWYRDNAAGTFVDAEVPTGVINGVNTVFTLSTPPDPPESLRLYLNGIVQTEGIDYALLGDTITYIVTPPQTGDSLIAWYRDGVTIGFVDAEVPTGTIDGSNAVFTLSETPMSPPFGSLMLFKNGVLQAPFPGTGDYTIAGNTIVFNAVGIPQTGDTLICWYRTGEESGAGAGWYRLNQTAAPETGLNWSPKAEINQNPDPTLAGCSAVQSLQVSPGVHRLLVGPFAEGPILMRDLSVYNDNGSLYDAWAQIGGIVLAKPGQIAGVNFVTTDSPKTGTAPLVSVWFNEDPKAAGAPAGYLLTDYVDDPTQLAASATIDGRRRYINQTGEPAWCRYMFVEFDWTQNDEPDELYSFTIFGNIYEEL